MNLNSFESALDSNPSKAKSFAIAALDLCKRERCGVEGFAALWRKVSKERAEEFHRREIGGSRCKGSCRLNESISRPTDSQNSAFYPHDLDDVINIAGKVSIEFFTKLKKTTEWDPESKVNWLTESERRLALCC